MTQSKSENTEFDFNKVLWNCRRGMLELDVILIPFAKAYFAELKAEQQGVFVDLLDEADPDLFNWLMGHGAPSQPELKTMVELIRSKNHHFNP